MTGTTTRAAADDAIRRHAWQEAFDLLRRADAEESLPAADLERLAEVAWWAAEPDAQLDALERAYGEYQAGGNGRRAGFVALLLAREYGARLQPSISAGWYRRAVRLLQNEEDCVERTYLILSEAQTKFRQDDYERAAELAARVTELGQRFGDPDLEAYGLMVQGMVLVSAGKPAEGLELLDEATVAAVSGELSPWATGIVYCNTIVVCRDVADFRRAGEWTDAARRWCERQAISGFPGVCRVHRAEIVALRGAWAEAEDEARRAADELAAFGRPNMAADGFYEIGEIRLRMGDLEGAEELFRQAHELGRAPQPGLALVQLRQGKVESARAGIREALAATTDPLHRARLLPVQAEVAAAAGDAAGAAAAAGELERITATYASPMLQAMAAAARGAVELTNGNGRVALMAAREAWTRWQEVEAPYEAASARVLMARAYRLLGDEESARLELNGALSTFDRLGATFDAATAARLLEERPGAGAGRRVKKTFVFTDIARSTNLVDALGDEAWMDVLRWHDETLRSLFGAHGGTVVDHTGDGFFVAFDDAQPALACAVEIQRRLADHRATHGFAPSVRIGLHATDATEVEGNYRGRGVHEAARIAAVADGGEIVASRSSVDGCEVTVVDPREVQLRGVSEPVEIVNVDWRASSPLAR